MGKRGRTVEFTYMRNCELHHAYHHAFYVASVPFTVDKIYRIAVSFPCSRFWISTETAAKLISDIRRGKKQNLKPMCLERITEIMRRCNGDYSRASVSRVVNSPAPKFYLTPGSAQAILSRFRCKK